MLALPWSAHDPWQSEDRAGQAPRGLCVSLRKHRHGLPPTPGPLHCTHLTCTALLASCILHCLHFISLRTHLTCTALLASYLHCLHFISLAPILLAQHCLPLTCIACTSSPSHPTRKDFLAGAWTACPSGLDAPPRGLKLVSLETLSVAGEADAVLLQLSMAGDADVTREVGVAGGADVAGVEAASFSLSALTFFRFVGQGVPAETWLRLLGHLVHDSQCLQDGRRA